MSTLVFEIAVVSQKALNMPVQVQAHKQNPTLKSFLDLLNNEGVDKLQDLIKDRVAELKEKDPNSVVL